MPPSRRPHRRRVNSAIFTARRIRAWFAAMMQAIANWTPRTPIFYGWVALAMAALGTFAATGVAQVVIGGVQSLIFEDMGWERSTIAFAVTAGTWASGLLTPFIGRLADRHGPRRLMPPAALVVGGCYLDAHLSAVSG